MKLVTFLVLTLFLTNAFAALGPYYAPLSKLKQVVESDEVRAAILEHDSDNYAYGIIGVWQRDVEKDEWIIKSKSCEFVFRVSQKPIETSPSGSILMGGAKYNLELTGGLCDE